jgi:hypothetical protein
MIRKITYIDGTFDVVEFLQEHPQCMECRLLASSRISPSAAQGPARIFFSSKVWNKRGAEVAVKDLPMYLSVQYVSPNLEKLMKAGG